MRESEEAAGGPEKPRKKRRWWKGIGQVVQGAAVAAADIGLLIGILHFPVSAETRSYGLSCPSPAGFGTIMNGVGDLWRE